MKSKKKSQDPICLDPSIRKKLKRCQHTAATSNNMEMTTSTMINEDSIYDGSSSIDSRINCDNHPNPWPVVNLANYSHLDLEQQSTLYNSPFQKVTSTNSSKKSRCKECDGCRAQDCGQCSNCLDKKKFGGSNVIKQACKYRVCFKFGGSIKHTTKKRDTELPPDSSITILPSYTIDNIESINDPRQKSWGRSLSNSPSSISICDKQFCDDNYSLQPTNYDASQHSSLSLQSPIISTQSLPNQHYLNSADYDNYHSQFYPDYNHYPNDINTSKQTDFCMHCNPFRLQNPLPMISYHQNYEDDPNTTDIPHSSFLWYSSQPHHSIYNEQLYYREFGE